MRLVRQKHKLGCVPACIAMVAGKSYDEALKIVHPHRRKGQHCKTRLIDVFFILRDLDIKFKLPVADIKLKTIGPAIIFIRSPEHHRWGHAVVWDGKRILDPLLDKSLPRGYYEKNLVMAVELL